MTAASGTIASLAGVGVTVDGVAILAGVTLDVHPREHLAVLGPNGSGKTTLLRVLSTYRYPTHGTASVLGATFGRADLRALRPRIGFVSTALDPLLRSRADALSLVAAARQGATWPPRDVRADSAAVTAARRALGRLGVEHLEERRVDTLSQGERQRVRIARALAVDPELLLLDEPFAGLDLGARESLLADLDAILADHRAPTVVLVTHHVEELPKGIRSALLLRAGSVVGSGPVAEVLTDDPVSEAFGFPVRIRAEDGRWRAVSRAPSTRT